MRHFRHFFLLFLTICLIPVHAQRFELPSFTLNEAETDLFNLINEYRHTYGLPPVALSKNLTYVAKLHVQDLAENLPYNERCNLHSWSSEGPWTACCYTEDHAQAACMWNKPQEISNYPGIGYEIAYWTDETLSPEDFAAKALAGWKRSTNHNVVIINKGRWKDRHWNAMGIGVYKGYAAVWFGEEKDPDQLVAAKVRP